MLGERLQRLIEEMIERGIRFDDAVGEFEKRFISGVLGSCQGSVTKAADRLGIHRNTLTRKMDVYHIKRKTG